MRTFVKRRCNVPFGSVLRQSYPHPERLNIYGVCGWYSSFEAVNKGIRYSSPLSMSIVSGDRVYCCTTLTRMLAARRSALANNYFTRMIWLVHKSDALIHGSHTLDVTECWFNLPALSIIFASGWEVKGPAFNRQYCIVFTTCPKRCTNNIVLITFRLYNATSFSAQLL